MSRLFLEPMGPQVVPQIVSLSPAGKGLRWTLSALMAPRLRRAHLLECQVAIGLFARRRGGVLLPVTVVKVLELSLAVPLVQPGRSLQSRRTTSGAR